MITSSLVLYKSNPEEVLRVLSCVEKSNISIVYVIDNSPTDELREVVTNATAKADYIFGQGNVGYGEGNNIGIKKALKISSTYHAILNPDIIFKGNCIDNLFDFMESHPEVGCVKPALTHVDGSFNASALSLPTPFMTFGRRLFPTKYSKSINSYFELKDCDLNVTREVPNMSGSFLFIRTEVFKRIGMFDTRYFMYFEDFDLVRRIHSDSKIVYYPEVTIVHAHKAEHKFNKKLFLISIKSAIKYFNKWGWFFDKDRTKWNKEARMPISIIGS